MIEVGSSSSASRGDLSRSSNKSQQLANCTGSACVSEVEQAGRHPQRYSTHTCVGEKFYDNWHSATCKFDNMCLNAATLEWEYYVDPDLPGGCWLARTALRGYEPGSVPLAACLPACSTCHTRVHSCLCIMHCQPCCAVDCPPFRRPCCMPEAKLCLLLHRAASPASGRAYAVPTAAFVRASPPAWHADVPIAYNQEGVAMTEFSPHMVNIGEAPCGLLRCRAHSMPSQHHAGRALPGTAPILPAFQHACGDAGGAPACTGHALLNHPNSWWGPQLPRPPPCSAAHPCAALPPPCRPCPSRHHR